MTLEERLRQVIEQAYSIVCARIKGGRIKIDNEASMQLQLGMVLQTLGTLCEYGENDRFSIILEHTFELKEATNKCPKKHARADIYMELADGKEKCTAIIELKYFKKANAREPNNRYDFFADLENLEQYHDQGKSQINYLIAGTDHSHYYSEASPISAETGDFNFRDGIRYEKGTPLQYRTKKPYGKDITLKHDYAFKWDIADSYGFIKVKIS